MKLKTKRLILRNFKKDDFTYFKEFISQEELRKSSLCEVPSEIEIKIMFENRLKDELTFAIELIEINKVIGEISLMEADEDEVPIFLKDKKIMDLGVEISKFFWNNGYGFESCKEIIKFSKNELKIDGLISSYFSFNTKSEKLHRKLGFEVSNIMNYETELNGIKRKEKLVINYLLFN